VELCHIIAMRQLIDRCAVGEGQAWRELHRTYAPVATRFLGRMGVLPDELDDACQEVFVQVFRYLARFERRADFQTWLYKICLSRAGRVRRRRRLHMTLRRLLGRELLTQQPSGWSEPMAAERVRRALDRMKPKHREVLCFSNWRGSRAW
jgi:RNA polymerase sigma-70 factor, ECF subfamily